MRRTQSCVGQPFQETQQAGVVPLRGVSTWISVNILNNKGFVGRTSDCAVKKGVK